MDKQQLVRSFTIARRDPLTDPSIPDDLMDTLLDAMLSGDAELLKDTELSLSDWMITVYLRRPTRNEWRNLLKNHSPREDNKLDQDSGYNTDTFGAALLKTVIFKVTSVEGERLDVDLDELLDDETGIAMSDWELLFHQAMQLATGTVSLGNLYQPSVR